MVFRVGRRHAITAAVLAAALVLLGLLASVALAAASTRYWADDYCYAVAARQHGFFGAEVSWYQDWTGRYTATAVMSLLTSLPVKVAAWSLPLLLVAWVATTAWTLRQVAPADSGQPPRVLALAGAAAVIASTVAIVPTRAQEVDWLTGATTYILPLVLVTPIAGLVLRALRRGRSSATSLASAGVLALLAAGCSESFTGTGLAALTILAAAAALRSRLRPALPVTVSALAGATAGLVILLLAPGNAHRVAALHAHGSFGNLFWPSIRFGAEVVATYVALTPIPLLLAVAAGAAAAVALPRPVVVRRPALTLLAALGLGSAMVYGAMVPAVYYAAQPPDRALLGTAELMVFGAAGLGFVLASSLRRQNRLAGAVALVVTGVLLVVTYPAQPAPLDDLHTAGPLAAQWDQRDAAIRSAAAAGRDSVVVARLTSGALVDDLQDAGVGGCPQQYYGIRIDVR